MKSKSKKLEPVKKYSQPIVFINDYKLSKSKNGSQLFIKLSPRTWVAINRSYLEKVLNEKES